VSETTRIRWHETPFGIIFGHVGTLEPPLFSIWKPLQASGEWVLTTELLGMDFRRIHKAGPEELKPEAELMLADFVSSLGALWARWGVFVRDADDDGEWTERHRWGNGKLMTLPDQEAAEKRAAETRDLHPEWEVEARQTAEPLPGDFHEAFAALLPVTGDDAATMAAQREERN
jgi:hypothetical protein